MRNQLEISNKSSGLFGAQVSSGVLAFGYGSQSVHMRLPEIIHFPQINPFAVSSYDRISAVIGLRSASAGTSPTFF
jgi:hypothetical protein